MTRLPAIASFDIPYHSRLAATLPLVRALVERGHRISAFTLEPYRALVARTGAEVVLQPDFGPDDPGFTVNLRAIDYAMQAVPALVDALQRQSPDLVMLTPKCLWAAIAAERCGLPTAVVHTNALWPRDVPVSANVRAARWPGKTEARIEAVIGRDRAAWRACRERFGIRRIADGDVVPEMPNCMNLRGDINVVYAAEQIQPHRERFDASFHFTGPCYGDRLAERDPALEAALDALPQPLLYASLGSMALYNERAALFRSIVSAVASGGFGAVVAVGGDKMLREIDAPAQVLVRAYVPQPAVLDRASLFITHAGSNSVYESLLAGVPMLMLPQGGDQPIMAEQMEQLGLGHWLRGDHELDPAALRGSMSRLLDDTDLRRRVRSAGDALRAAGGVQRACTLITDFVCGECR